MCRFAQYKTLLIPFFFTEQNSTWSRIRSGSWRTEMMCLRSGKLMNQFYVNEPSAFETPFFFLLCPYPVVYYPNSHMTTNANKRMKLLDLVERETGLLGRISHLPGPHRTRLFKVHCVTRHTRQSLPVGSSKTPAVGGSSHSCWLVWLLGPSETFSV